MENFNGQSKAQRFISRKLFLSSLLIFGSFFITGSYAAATTNESEKATATDTTASKYPGFVMSSPTAKNGNGKIHDLSDILAMKKIVIAIPSGERSIFVSQDANGQFSGYSIDLANDIGKSLGVEVVFNSEAKTFEDVIDLLVANKADLAVCNLSKTSERAKKVLFSDPDVTLYQTLLVNRIWAASKQKDFVKEEDLVKDLNTNHGKIAVLEGTSYQTFAKKIFTGAEIISFPKLEEAIFALRDGKVEAVFDDDLQVQQILNKDPSLELKFKTMVLEDKPDVLAIAAQPNEWNLWQWTNQFLEIRHEKVSTEKLLTSYQGK